MSRFNASNLEGQGFRGFAQLRDLPARCLEIPAAAGAYVVMRHSPTEPQFAQRNLGGHFKGKDPTVAVEVLREKWVRDALVLYIGRASQLRRRIGQYARFGRGEPIGHWGGRYVWQLQDAGDLQIAWKVDLNFKTLESDLLLAFAEAYEALPFANLNRPRALR